MNKIKDFCVTWFYKLKTGWRTPPRGYDCSYKEVGSITVGFCGISMMSILIQWTTLAVNIQFITEYFKVSSGMIWILTVLGTLIGLVRAPIISMMVDNHNSKKGKFKPFIMWSAIISIVAYVLIPFIPQAWTTQSLFSFSMPELSLFGVEAGKYTVTLAVLVLFILLQIGGNVYQLLLTCMSGVENTVSTVAQERANIGVIKGLLSNLPNSVVNIIMPLFAGFLFSVPVLDSLGNPKLNENGDQIISSGFENPNLYKIFFPICGVLAILAFFFIIRGTKERTIVENAHKNRVSFWKGAWLLTKNKYFWIILLFNALMGIRAQANIHLWVCNYAIGGEAGGIVLSICGMLLNNAFIPGQILGPFLIKKFGKRNCLIVASVGFVAMTLMQLLFIETSAMILISIFFQNLFSGVGFMAVIMVSDIFDHEQWKTNKRIEGFWHSYYNVALAIIGIFTGVLAPFVMAQSGIPMDAEVGDYLVTSGIRTEVFRNITLLALVGGIITAIPMFFYDITERKHRCYIDSLKIRKAVTNLNNNELKELDVIETYNIVTEVNTLNNEGCLTKSNKKYGDKIIVKDEIAKYSAEEIGAILDKYEIANANYSLKVEYEDLVNLESNIDFEEKIIKLQIDGAKRKHDTAEKKKQAAASKKGGEYTPVPFDSEAKMSELIAKSRFVKDKEKLARKDEVKSKIIDDALNVLTPADNEAATEE